MQHIPMQIMIFASIVVSTILGSSDNSKVADAFRNLQMLHSYRSNMIASVQGNELTICTERMSDPKAERTTITLDCIPLISYGSALPTPIVIHMMYTHGTTYVQDSKTGDWTRLDPGDVTKDQSESIHHELLRNVKTQSEDLEVGKYDFTYQGSVQLEHTQTLLYSFKGKPSTATSRDEGKVWVGEADHLPRRFDLHSAKTGLWSITFDNFNVPVSIELPSVEKEGQP